MNKYPKKIYVTDERQDESSYLLATEKLEYISASDTKNIREYYSREAVKEMLTAAIRGTLDGILDGIDEKISSQ